ncbi:Protein CBG25402 [Caenorhabditis briggsae]|uniref:Protein CBG25402 n=1 Tax=Caenorhabditis briggsae TaxID=6238 RepID=B6IH54_CAEBR|nr:Protein CBG25402 [Caenorhabditis briggsae]CAR99234.1 Protein CBG25402 [Caenorhabditis briggsae]
MSEDPILLSRPFLFVLLGILIYIPISYYYWFLALLAFFAGFCLLSKVLKNGKRILLFLTYGESQEGTLETLTVYRTERGRLEKKILKDGRFEIIGEKQIFEFL